MKKKTVRETQSVTLPASVAQTALYFLKRVVVHGEEQSQLIDAYHALAQALTQSAMHIDTTSVYRKSA